MIKKIVVTGMGAVTPVGIGIENYWNGLLAGKTAIGPITRIDTETLSVKNAGEIKDFNPKEYLPSRMCQQLDTFMQYAYISAEEALKDSGLDADSDRVGIAMGTALAGLSLIGNTQQNRSAGKKVGPRFVSQVMGNIAAAQFAIAHGAKGPSITTTTACSSGGDAIKVASMFIELGEADAMVVMAGESAISASLIESLARAGALSKSGNSLPFDVKRDGFVMGEGGGAIILETEEHAKARGAHIYCELLAVANNNDAYDTVAPTPDGSGAAKCIQMALDNAGIKAGDVSYLNVHGTATHAGDIAEVGAIHTIFGDYQLPISSTKGITGHLMGAAGMIEAIACVKAIETGIIPPNVGMDEQDPECDVNVITTIEKRDIKVAMSNSLGFGGQNSCTIFGRYEG